MVATPQQLVERVWTALKERCAADPSKAKRVVMVSRDDIAAALSASGIEEMAEALAPFAAQAADIPDHWHDAEWMADDGIALQYGHFRAAARALATYRGES